MHRARLFFLWLVMLAVPFQGYAAAAMVFCGPHAGAAADLLFTQLGADEHAHHPRADGHRDHEHMVAEAPKPPAKDSTATTGSAESDASHKCGNCAPCHAVGLTPSVAVIPNFGLPQADLVEPLYALAIVSPGVPQKPPRA